MPKIMRLAEVLRFILNHPLNQQHRLRALGRFLRWQVGGRLAPGAVIISFVDHTRIVARPGLMGATGIYYTGLYEFEEMAFVLHALRPGDCFVDVGAHIGAFSVLAAGAVGAGCLAIEPVPASFACLLENTNLNGLSAKIRAVNAGIADCPGRLRFTTAKGAANGVVPANSGAAHFQSAQELASTVEVDVLPLDALTGDFFPARSSATACVTKDAPSEAFILKIDVEGYEHAVIAGAAKTLADERLVAILIELRGHGARYGFDEDAIHQRLLEAGFQPYSYAPAVYQKGKGIGEKGEGGDATSCVSTLKLLPGINRAAGTTLYLRSLELIQNRLASAPRFSVHGQEV